MNKIAVIYKSEYGASKQYAEWISEELDAEIFKASSVAPNMLMDYDVVVYGAGLYAGQINGAKLIAKNPCKKWLIVFTTGIADPAITDYSGIMAKNFTPEWISKINAFHLRGAIKYEKLGFAHKTMMGIFKKMLVKKVPSQMSSEEKAVVETNGEDVNFIDRSSIEPLVEYVRSL